MLLLVTNLFESSMFESKRTTQYRHQQMESAAIAAAYELLINTNLSVDRAREYFLVDYPDFIEVFEEVVEDCQSM